MIELLDVIHVLLLSVINHWNQSLYLIKMISKLWQNVLYLADNLAENAQNTLPHGVVRVSVQVTGEQGHARDHLLRALLRQL